MDCVRAGFGSCGQLLKSIGPLLRPSLRWLTQLVIVVRLMIVPHDLVVQGLVLRASRWFRCGSLRCGRSGFRGLCRDDREGSVEPARLSDLPDFDFVLTEFVTRAPVLLHDRFTPDWRWLLGV